MSTQAQQSEKRTMRAARPRARASRLRLWLIVALAIAVAALGLYGVRELLPILGVRWEGELSALAERVTAVVIFAGTYLVIAIGRFPGFRIDRAGAALVGASLMVGSGVLTLEEAYAAIDFDTITLLLGMMIVVANLRLSGFFAPGQRLGGRAARIGRCVLLAAIVVVSGVFSAFLVNDAICLVLTPLVLDLTLRLKRNPVPYLLAVAMASNVGCTATITGNPQNMMIGSFSHIPYRHVRRRAGAGGAGGARCSRSRCSHSLYRARIPGRATRLAPRPTGVAFNHALIVRDQSLATALPWSRSSSPAAARPRRRSSAARCCCSRGGSRARGLCRDRLVAAADVRRPVHRRRRRSSTRC